MASDVEQTGIEKLRTLTPEQQGQVGIHQRAGAARHGAPHDLGQG